MIWFDWIAKLSEVVFYIAVIIYIIKRWKE